MGVTSCGIIAWNVWRHVELHVWCSGGSYVGD